MYSFENRDFRMKVKAFVRKPNNKKPNSIGGYIHRDISTKDYNFNNQYKFENSSKIERVCIGNDLLHSNFVKRKKELKKNYGKNAKLWFGNILETKKNKDMKNSTTIKLPDSGFIALCNGNYLFIECHFQTYVHQFYCKLEDHTNDQLTTFGDEKAVERLPKMFSYKGSNTGRSGKLTMEEEKIVLELLALGKRQKAIANRFGISERTVRNIKNRHT